MSTHPETTTIVLAAENDDLYDYGSRAAAAIFPGANVRRVDLAAFDETVQLAQPSPELLMLALQADEDGRVSPGDPLVRQLMSAHVPILVVRKRRGDSAAMSAPTRIVVPLDGSDTAGQAVPIAQRMAGMLNLPVQFVMVIDPARVLPAGVQYDPDAWDVIEELRSTAHWALRQAEDLLRTAGVEVTSELLYGPRGASLKGSVQENDLVVMTTHGLNRSGMRGRASVTLDVLTSVPQPMLVMRASRQTHVIEACHWLPEN